MKLSGATSTLGSLSNSTTEIISEEPDILIVDNKVEAEVLFTSWLLHSGASYHVTPHRSQFWQYTAYNFDSFHVGNSQQCAIISIGTVELNLLGGSTLVLHDF